MAEKRLAIIMPSFRDERILEAIASVRAFDDIGCVKLVVIDGGSPEALIQRIAAALGPDDVFVAEPDDGIFDGLNKGLARVDTDYMGWLGSDDLFTGDVPASEVVAQLAANDLFIASMAFFRGDRIRRITHSWPASRGLLYFGLHNPHYATFGRSALLKSVQFEIANPVADQQYFLRIFDRRPRVAHTAAIATLAGEGGFSNASYRKILIMNGRVFGAYRAHGNAASAALAVALKLGYKGSMRLWFKLRRVEWPLRYPQARRAMHLARERTADS